MVRVRVDLHNTLHIVAGDVDDARQQFIDAMKREGGDRGIEAARQSIHRDLDGLVLEQPAATYDVTLRAERLAAQQRVYETRTAAWKTAAAEWEQRHPGESAAAAAEQLARLEQQLQDTTGEIRDLEHARIRLVDEARRHEWTTDHTVVDRARIAAETAPADARTAAETTYQQARAAFRTKHGHDPAPVPPKAAREVWQKAAIAPGADPRIDQARGRADALTAKLKDTRRDPAPPKPTPPVQGSPAQELAQDPRTSRGHARYVVARMLLTLGS